MKEHLFACLSKYGSIDLERFQEYIIQKADFKSEGYELKFLGKNYVRLLASVDKTAVLSRKKSIMRERK